MEIDVLQTLLALSVGVSLAAACGFRVFVPLLTLALGVRYLGLQIDDSLSWVSSDAAIICLGVASIVEILAYYIPVIDNLLDTITGPAALVAGTLVTAGVLGDLPDWMQWGTGIIAGAGAAGAVQLSTSAVRVTGTTTTAGISNPIISTIENILATIGSVLAVFMPLLAVIGAVLMIFLTFIFLRRVRDSIARRRSVTA